MNGFWICDLGRYGYKSDLEAPRGASSELLENGRRTSVSVAEALSWAAARLRAAAADRTVVVLTSELTNEEFRAAKALFVDRLGIRRIFFADPPAGEAEGMLLAADRTPNRRGAEAAGFAFRPAGLESFAGGTDLLLAFGGRFGDAAAGLPAGALSAIPAKGLFSSRLTAGDDLFDAVVPTLRPAEKTGSFTNIDGRVQAFASALPGPEQCPAEADIIARLAGEAG